MDLDATTLWIATRSPDAFKRVRDMGVDADLMVGSGKAAWKFVAEYWAAHGEIPGVTIIAENTGAAIRPPEEGEEVAVGYLVERLHERAIHRALKYGLAKSLEALEQDKQDDSVTEVIKLSDHLRKRRIAQVQLRTLGQIAPEVYELYQRTKKGEIGIPFPWPTMTQMTMGLWPGTLTFFVARPGVGKCVEENTKIVNPVTGVETTVRQVVEGDQLGVYSWDERSASGIDILPIDAKVDTGVKRCMEVVLASGRSIVVTPEHPFLTPSGWVRADELGHRAIVGVPAGLPEPQRPVPMGIEVVRVLALLLAEGSYSGNHVGFSTSDERMIEIARVFSAPRGATVVQRSKYDYDISTGNVGGGTVAPNPARQLLRSLGIDGCTAREKRIPDAVYSLPDSELSEFLSVFWMADGYVDRGAPSITLASEEMVRQIQHLLLRFGVQSSVVYKPIKGGFHSWRLRVYSLSWPRFAEAIPLWGEKDRRMKEAVARVGVRNPNAGSPKRVKKLPGVFWERVVRVSDAGVRRIFDLTVRPTSNFVANDIIVHNTWTAVIMALHAWQAGKKVLIVSPELSRVELGERLVSKHGKFAYTDMVSATLGVMGEAALKKQVEELERIGQNFFVLDDEDHIGPESIEQAIEVVEPDIVFVDSIYMMRVADGKVKKGAGSKGGRYDRILETIDWLRGTSRRHQVPVVGISQLSRDAKMKKESADQIKRGKGTGGLEDAVAMTDTLFMDAHNLFALFQDQDLMLDKQLIYVPLKVRRSAMRSHVVIRWDMTAMDFSEIGTFVPNSSGSSAGSGYEDKDYETAF